MLKRLLKLPTNKSFFLFGARQTGKSTLIKATFAKQSYILYDLLDPDTFNLLASNPSIFKDEILARDKSITHIVVDEIQKLPVLLDMVHMIIESKNAPYFCLSGSSVRKLKKSGANLLGGRAWTLSLSPLTFTEIENNHVKFNLDDALSYGTLPAVFLEKDESAKQQTLRAYVNTYLKEEIKEEALVRNIGGFTNFLKFAAEENGNLINYTNISRDVGVDNKTIKEYFFILEDTLLGFFLLPFTRSHRERLVKHPKFYFFDTGVQRALTNKLNVKLQKKTKEYGNVFEHFLIKEIINMSNYKLSDFEFSFYRTEAGAEVDLIIRRPDKKVLAIEIKAKDNPALQDLRGLFSFKEICPEAELICASLAPRKRYLKNILICPWQEIFEVIEN